MRNSKVGRAFTVLLWWTRIWGCRSLVAAALLAAFVAGACLAEEKKPPSDLSQPFAYDSKAPLELTDKILEQDDTCEIHDVSYRSPGGGRVNAYLVVPKGKGPHAAILFGHWGNGTRAEFLPEARIYAAKGAVSLLPDYPWERTGESRKKINNFGKPEIDKAIYIQTIVDLRRGIDLLLSRAGTDPQRLAYVGHSYGAQWGAILAAVDARPQTAILMGGLPAMSSLLTGSSPDLLDFAEQNKGLLSHYMDVMQEFDPVRYVTGSHRAPLLFQFARYEEYFSRPEMERYFTAATPPKEVMWYSTDHALNDPRTLQDRQAWLAKHIGLK